MAAAMTIDELILIHDSEPTVVATALRSFAIDGVASSDLARYAWLVNHVIGEKLGAWYEALDLHHRISMESRDIAVFRHLAVAASIAGAPIEAWTIETQLAEEAQASVEAARAAVRFGVLQFAPENISPIELARVFCACLKDIAADQPIGKLGPILAGSLNNVVSKLLDHPSAPTEEIVYRQALSDGAQICRKIWQGAGNWMNHERADYLVALCCNKLEDWAGARDAAQSGLKTIDANGSEDVDRAFLLLELGRAWRGLGDETQRATVRTQALELSKGFDDELRKWFASRAQA